MGSFHAVEELLFLEKEFEEVVSSQIDETRKKTVVQLYRSKRQKGAHLPSTVSYAIIVARVNG